jgi:hypothetical protein
VDCGSAKMPSLNPQTPNRGDANGVYYIALRPVFVSTDHENASGS